MSWFDLPRVPEPEVMDDGAEVEAYASAAAQAYLSKLDDTLVDHAIRLLDSKAGGAGLSLTEGRALDIGTGPGQIVFKLAQRLPRWHVTGIDRSPRMIAEAFAERDRLARSAADGGNARARVEFLLADGCRAPFADATFDLVLCNSVLHHLEDPARLLREIGRVAKPNGAVLVRDLRRPSRLAYTWHVRRHGRHYSGLMYKLYCDSVRAAYRPEEIAGMLRSSPIAGASVFTGQRTHLGIERERQS